MKRIVILTAAFVLAFAALAQQPPVQPPAQPQGQVVIPKTPYDSTKAQLSVAKEENLQLKANAIQVAFQQNMKDMQSQWQAEEAALNVWIAQIRRDNGWDATYTYDREKNQWVHAPKAEPKPETKSAEAPKK
jgi:hypothetical protein